MIPPRLEPAPALPRRGRGLPLFGAAVFLGIAAVWSARLALQQNLVWGCPMLQLTDVPCPFCGGTRALAALAALEVRQAVAFNPLAVLGLALWPFALKHRDARWLWPVGSALLLANWLYLWLRLPR